MAADVEDDDELDQEDKPKPKPQPIGNPIVAAPVSSGESGRFQDVRPIMPQPAQTTKPTPIMAASAPPQAPAGAESIGAPINPYVPAPRPAAERAESLAANPPEYHGWNRFLDTLAGTTTLGRGIEAASGLGSVGYDVKMGRAERAAEDESKQLAEGQRERQGQATIEETQGRTAEAEANAEAKRQGMQDVIITLGDGRTMNLPQNSPLARTILAQAGAEQRTTETNKTRQDIATETNKTKEDIAAGKPQPTKVLVVNGKSHVMERDPKTGEYSIDRGEAPPNYAQVAPDLRTVTVIDPDTQLPITRTLGGKVEGVSGTGAYAHQMEQAGAVNRMAEHVIQSFEANRNQVGTLAAWVKKYGINTPIGDPKLSEMQAELFSFSSMSPALHQFRAVTAQEAAENILGGLQKNPDATIAALRVIGETTARAINPNIKTGGEEKGNAPNDKSQWQQSNGKYRYSNDGGKTWHNFTQP